MEKPRILVVEDEAPIQELLRFNLERKRYRVKLLDSGERAPEAAKDFRPDLILLDLMLPDLDGLEVCKRLKADPETADTPIIMLTALSEESDVITGLELGACDYVTKPFSIGVLMARVKAVLRRGATAASEPSGGRLLRIHGLTVDPDRIRASANGTALPLTATEFRILHLLASQPGRVFTRTQIIDRVHGDDYPVTDRSVDVQIVGLRKKLGAEGRFIETVRGVGYRFREEGS